MAIYLDENMVGSDANMIAFPHLVLCMGVVLVMSDGSLIGAHFTTPDVEKGILNMMVREVAGSGQTMNQMYCIADLAEHIQKYGGQDINGKAAGLGFTGQGYVIDLGCNNPADGCYAQVTSNGSAQRATVRTKLNEKMDYTFTADAGPNVTKVGMGTMQRGQETRAFTIGSKTTAAAAKNAQSLDTPFLKPVTVT